MDYNKFRLLMGRLFGLLILLFLKKELNYTGFIFIAAGIFIRSWASGYIHKGQEVTRTGPYMLVRHPLYLGSFLLGLGMVLFFDLWWVVLLYIPLFIGIYYRKIRLEEKFLLEQFHDQYRDFQRETPAFLPDFKGFTRIFKQKGFSFRDYLRNREYLNTLGLALIMLFLLLFKSLFYDYLIAFRKILTDFLTAG
ncbi:MAG: methyltransferase family protein [Bacillota bacterium]